MARPRKWKTDAERKRAERAAKLGTTAKVPQPEVVSVEVGPGLSISDYGSVVATEIPEREETADWEGKRWPVLRSHSLSEDEYVDMEARHTRDAIQRGLKDPDGKRVERSEKYARWRYRGYQAGEIRSL
jgi:hypothetical protein